MFAPNLRHRITLQEQTPIQDTTTGAVVLSWTDWLVDEPAEVVPLSGREFLQAQTTQVQVDARMTIRWRTGVLPTMRAQFDGATYQITAVLPDPSARRWLTLMVKQLVPYADQ